MRAVASLSPRTLGLFVSSVLGGILTGIFEPIFLWPIVQLVTDVFLRILQFLSLPLIFFAVVATLSELENSATLRNIGGRMIRYTVLTTWLAAAIALICFIGWGVAYIPSDLPTVATLSSNTESYLHFARQIIPDNGLRPFLENQTIAVAFIALLFGMSILHLPAAQRGVLQPILSALFAALLKIATTLLRFLPLAIWAFIALAVHEYRASSELFAHLGYYVLAVISANLIQGLIVLPLLLWWKGISPIKSVRAMAPALLTAFFSKSSSTTLPLTLSCVTNRAGVSPKVANTVVPLCTVLNMNGCAAFILITVLFVSTQHGIVFSFWGMAAWTIIATLAAIGNAGVPMGCFFLTSALLMSQQVPLTLMGLILPLYTIFDMVETALNVWSDACVTLIIQKDLDKAHA